MHSTAASMTRCSAATKGVSGRLVKAWNRMKGVCRKPEPRTACRKRVSDRVCAHPNSRQSCAGAAMHAVFFCALQGTRT